MTVSLHFSSEKPKYTAYRQFRGNLRREKPYSSQSSIDNPSNGWVETSRPGAIAEDHRIVENLKPSKTGHKGKDHYH